MKKYLIIVFTLLMLIPEGCKKYEDGPWLSFRSKKKRLLGEWNIELYQVNGIDSTINGEDIIAKQIYFKFIDKTTNGRPNKFRKRLEIPNDFGYPFYNLYGDWDFLDDGKKISMRFVPESYEFQLEFVKGVGPFGTNKVSKWYIKRFTFDDLWLETDYEENIYYMKLKKERAYED